MAPPGGEIKCLFHRSKPTFSAAKKNSYLYPSGELKKFCGDLKTTINLICIVNLIAVK